MTSLTKLALSMSNREIADLTGKRPDNVARDIRDMLAALYDGVTANFLPENILRNQQSSDLRTGYSVSQYGVNNAGLRSFSLHNAKGNR